MSKEIDNKIAELKYNPLEILAFKGENIENFKKAEGKHADGKYIVIERKKVSLSDLNVDIGIVDSMTDLTYPGALVLANSGLVENRPDALSVKRKPAEYVIDLPGLEKDAVFTVADPKYGTVKSAIDEKFNNWCKNYSGKYSIVARSYYSESMARSESQILAKFGFGIKQALKDLDVDFKATQEARQSTYIASFRQIFYTVSTSGLPNNPSDLFDDSVTWQDLARQGVNNDNPPAFVYKVAYGRSIFVKLQSSVTTGEVEAAFKAVMKDAHASSEARYKHILDNTSFTVVVMGGGISGQNEIIKLKDPSQLKDIIANHSTCDAGNPGYPVSYSTVFLKDNKVAAINSSTDYIETTTTEYQNAEIVLKHTGGYVAQFIVRWNEITYNDKGDRIVTPRAWSGNSSDRTAPFSTSISLQGNSENLCVFAKECTGLVWEWWRTVFDKKNIPLVKKRTFHIYGTTLNQKYTIDPHL